VHRTPIQSLTRDALWHSGSTDFNDQGRPQVLDRNWVVCTSSPPPGAKLTVETEDERWSDAYLYREVPLTSHIETDLHFDTYRSPERCRKAERRLDAHSYLMYLMRERAPRVGEGTAASTEIRVDDGDVVVLGKD
jgi:hypothetical protein